MTGLVNYGSPDEGATGIPSATTTGTGAAYVATVEGVEALTNGLMIIITPHVVSTSTTPTLNVNSLGAKGIRRQQSTTTAGTTAGPSASWLTANKPLLLQYNGTYWVVLGKEQPVLSDASGTLPMSKGGTGATTAAAAIHALINGLTALTATDLADGDTIALDDASGATGKKVTMANLVAYLSGLMGGARIQTGSYVGTGTYGSSNPCSLTFDFVPQLVIIWGQEAAGYSTTVKVELMENLYYVQHYNNSSFGTTVGAGKNTNVGYILQWNKTIKFYAGNQSNEYQPNKSNITYNYIAFG